MALLYLKKKVNCDHHQNQEFVSADHKDKKSLVVSRILDIF